MRGEEAEGSGSGAQSSRLLCALPVRRSVPAKVGHHHFTRIITRKPVLVLETRDPVGRGNKVRCLTVETSEGGWEGRIPSQPTLWWRKLVVQ